MAESAEGGAKLIVKLVDPSTGKGRRLALRPATDSWQDFVDAARCKLGWGPDADVAFTDADGDTVAITHVLQRPPSDSCSKRVSFESR